MWIELIRGLSPEHKFGPPASESAILVIEERLGVRFHPDLRSFYLECNGADDGLPGALVWPLETMLEENLFWRTNEDYRGMYMPFDNVVIFGSPGTGARFILGVTGTKKMRHDIYLWNNYEDSRSWCAPDLKTYLERWLKNELSV